MTEIRAGQAERLRLRIWLGLSAGVMALAVVIALVTVWTGIVVSYETNWPLGFLVGTMGAFFFLAGRAYRAAAGRFRPRVA